MGHHDESNREVVKALKAIRDAGSDGLPSTKFAQMLGLKTPKGLGPVTISMNNRLRAVGIKPDQVFERSRVDGERKWFKKDKIEEAIKALEV